MVCSSAPTAIRNYSGDPMQGVEWTRETGTVKSDAATTVQMRAVGRRDGSESQDYKPCYLSPLATVCNEHRRRITSPRTRSSSPPLGDTPTANAMYSYRIRIAVRQHERAFSKA
ncbi:hypothetical protein PISMIDRAFT_678375 [Pisolithus microcarpus 441]|uniref:Uncharacterized protein n=1 Tax=Pisolithus microcarpus 441 TaxID=765257 RepID=A0A0C9ZEK7_9AGAM|nr:hypothetical protein PISMIDRAFT_678375 [Pisolithus microcarpus 441]